MNKSNSWKRRAHILRTATSLYKTLNAYGGVRGIKTPEEEELISDIIEKLSMLLNKSVESSRELGFDAKYRCRVCKKILTDFEYNQGTHSCDFNY